MTDKVRGSLNQERHNKREALEGVQDDKRLKLDGVDVDRAGV